MEYFHPEHASFHGGHRYAVYTPFELNMLSKTIAAGGSASSNQIVVIGFTDFSIFIERDNVAVPLNVYVRTVRPEIPSGVAKPTSWAILIGQFTAGAGNRGAFTVGLHRQVQHAAQGHWFAFGRYLQFQITNAHGTLSTDVDAYLECIG